MFQLRIFGEPAAMEPVERHLEELPGARHVIRAGDGNGRVLITADVQPHAADAALAALDDLGVAPDDVALVRLDLVQPGRLRRANLVVWADLLGQAGEYSRPGEGDFGVASGALAVLSINVACLILGGTAGLVTQRLVGVPGHRRA